MGILQCPYARCAALCALPPPLRTRSPFRRATIPRLEWCVLYVFERAVCIVCFEDFLKNRACVLEAYLLAQ